MPAESGTGHATAEGSSSMGQGATKALMQQQIASKVRRAFFSWQIVLFPVPFFTRLRQATAMMLGARLEVFFFFAASPALF
jgi:hypothetical protein